MHMHGKQAEHTNSDSTRTLRQRRKTSVRLRLDFWQSADISKCQKSDFWLWVEVGSLASTSDWQTIWRQPISSTTLAPRRDASKPVLDVLGYRHNSGTFRFIISWTRYVWLYFASSSYSVKLSLFHSVIDCRASLLENEQHDRLS